MDEELGGNSLFKDRKKLKAQRQKREHNKEVADRRATLVTDLTSSLSELGITLKGPDLLHIVDNLIKNGWTKKEFDQRKWH